MRTRTTSTVATLFASGVLFGWPVQPTALAQPANGLITPAEARAIAKNATHSQSVPPQATVPVTAENFIRAESDLYFGNVVKDGGFGKFLHRREPAAIDKRRRRLGYRPVRRLRRQDSELPADHAGLELHRASLPPAKGNPRRKLEVPRGTARSLSAPRNIDSAPARVGEIHLYPRPENSYDNHLSRRCSAPGPRR